MCKAIWASARSGPIHVEIIGKEAETGHIQARIARTSRNGAWRTGMTMTVPAWELFTGYRFIGTGCIFEGRPDLSEVI